jgi:hypothetical protein
MSCIPKKYIAPGSDDTVWIWDTTTNGTFFGYLSQQKTGSIS